MSKLLNSLSMAEGKTAYQSYLLEHGIERFTVLIPVKSVKTFEQAFAKLTKTKDSIEALVTEVGGKLRT